MHEIISKYGIIYILIAALIDVCLTQISQCLTAIFNSIDFSGITSHLHQLSL